VNLPEAAFLDTWAPLFDATDFRFELPATFLLAMAFPSPQR
jgi:hypothetical protein